MLNSLKFSMVLCIYCEFITIALSTGETDSLVDHCGGKQQSPVNIDTLSVKTKSFKSIHKNPKRLSLANFVNTGHSIQIIPEMSSRATISGGPMKDQKYKLEQIHFHWGENDHVGSEHLINKRSFPLEMHLVFYNMKYFNFSVAMELTDGLVVMGVLFKIAKKDNPHLNFTQKFSQISEYNASTEHDFHGQSYSSLLPSTKNLFYTYHGSLTTPPCTESVTWIVFMDQIPISSRQLKTFRSFQTEDGEILFGNYRPVQPLNNRIIYSSCDGIDLPER